ncbi:NlpC/P60 family protein [Ammoniphilus sp. CFH 90114]|nr:NlpC/P60 family protein [Ammoniphilus sp. CFH 90114]
MCMIIVLLLTACGAKLDPYQMGVQRETVAAASLMVGEKSTFSDILYRKDNAGHLWIPLEEAAQSLDFQTHWDVTDETFSMGYTDVIYQVSMKQTEAWANGQDMILSMAPQTFKQKPYITIDALQELWGTSVTWSEARQCLTIAPMNDKRIEDGSPVVIEVQGQVGMSGKSMPELHRPSLVHYARRYLGVPYQFGADPYPQSKRFDCSSFTRHVYSRFGIELPRTARAQAAMGIPVSSENMKPGDMLFFQIPGRFQTNSIVGHAGIYIGDGKFVHTHGKNGVTINSIQSGYWKENLLFTKRLSK